MPLTEAEAAYLAGILDGEGSISLVRSHAKRTRGRYVYPLVRIANTDEVLIEWIRSKIEGGHKGYVSKIHIRCKDVHHVGWASEDAIAVLKLVLPYLIIKADRARLVISLWETNEQARAEAGGYFGNGHPIPDWLMGKRLDAYEEMLRLNARGRATPSH